MCFTILKKLNISIFSKWKLDLPVNFVRINIIHTCFLCTKKVISCHKLFSFHIFGIFHNAENGKSAWKSLKFHVKKKATQNWDDFMEKTQHTDLHIIIRHPSMSLFFSFIKKPGLGFFFWRNFEFFQDFVLIAHFLLLLGF